jgi:hypothetical protein
MKCFTAALLARFGSEESAVANAAQTEWENACERYNAYIDSVKGEMPPGLREIEDSYHLHDAKVWAMGKQARLFVIVLQLDTPPHSLLTFTFELIDEPSIDTKALPPELCSKGTVVKWQYDELECLPGEPSTWSWSILFSNGWEIRLHFRDVQVQETEALLPTPRQGQKATRVVSRSA